MPTNTTEISKRFKLLCNNDPRVYEQLIRLVDQRVEEITVAVTEAAPDQILVAQGRAQEARKFLRLMIEFPEEPAAQPEPVIPPGP